MTSFFTSIIDSVNTSLTSYIKSTSLETIRIKEKTYQCTKLLGEGGFAQVFLALDENQQQYAIKKIRCKLGNEQVKRAKQEIKVHGLFQHKYIVPILDTTILKDSDGYKVVYIIMPFYKRGTLQDNIEYYYTSGKHFTERQIYKLFKDICYALNVLHLYNSSEQFKDGKEEKEDRNIKPWAHRDIKPGNIMISDSGKPLLMDFGSTLPANLTINNNKEAMQHQDIVNEHSSMPYRSPELMDVKVGTTINEKVDVWSLGCSIFTMAYGESPFEKFVNSHGGGSLSLAILNGQFKFPDSPTYSTNLKDLISWMMTMEINERPSVTQVI
ncbi:kinase-like domain-containing protein [Cunninghamella echinulata]|nr:kinase-like domain-containing protein [Cunninghamella echinulata]